MGTQIWGKVHNFGIYRKGGKRCILQLDFPGRALFVIQKGHIKKTHSFDALHHYDSEEGLHISLKFSDGDIDFEADNTEEKYTICRLLGFILQMGQGEDDESVDSGQGMTTQGDQQPESAEIIKEGLLEKKGNTTITTWNKRKVRLTPGEFSYFKPGEELALNVVQLWQETCEVKKLGQNGFSVTVRDRVYSFRLSSEYKAMNMTEIVRDEWIVAFQQALNQVPSTVRMFDQPLNGHNQDDHIYDVTPDIMDGSEGALSRNRRQLPANGHSSGEITAHVTVRLNYVDNGQLTRAHSSDDLLAVSDPSTGDQTDSNGQSFHADSGAHDDDPFAGSAAAFRAKLAMRGGKSSSLKTYRAEKDFKKKHGRSTGSSRLKLMTYHSEDQTLQIRPVGVHSLDRLQSNEQAIEKTPLAKSVSDSINGKPATVPAPALKHNDPPTAVVKRMRGMPPPPLPPTARPSGPLGAPPLPPTGPPPPPPLMKLKDSVQLQRIPNVKLKQVHWVKVNSNQISSSLWKDARDMTEKLDLAELEEQFCLQDKKPVPVKPKPVEEKQMLIDAKRAQNLGILFCGLKLESLVKLTDALNSTTEVDSFPADKMATLKRYQPTTEDREMYKLYTNRRGSLHNVDVFMLELCEIPRLSLRLDLALTLWEFPAQYGSLEEEVNDLLSGCEEISASSALTTVLEYLLAIGNYMNSFWNAKRGAQGFQISSIEKVLSVKGCDSHTTLCTYLVKQLKLNQPELLAWPTSMSHVTKCAGYSVKAVGAEIDVLKNDLQKIKKILKNIRSPTNTDEKTDKKFLTDVQNFIVEYDRKIDQMDAKYLKVTERYKLLLIKFGELPNKAADSSLFTNLNQFMELFNQAVAKMK